MGSPKPRDEQLGFSCWDSLGITCETRVLWLHEFENHQSGLIILTLGPRRCLVIVAEPEVKFPGPASYPSYLALLALPRAAAPIPDASYALNGYLCERFLREIRDAGGRPLFSV